MDAGYPSHPLGAQVIQVSHAGGKGRSRAIFYIYRVCLKEVLLSQSHRSKKDKNLDGNLGKPSLPAKPLEEAFLEIIIAPSLKGEPLSKLKGRVQREEPGSISYSFLKGFRKQMATGNDQFHQAPSPGGESSLESSAVSTAYKIALRWFYFSTWA